MNFNNGDYCNKKNIICLAFLIAGILAFILTAAIISGDIISKPDISVESVDISKITINETSFDVILIIDNKNFFGGTVKNLSFDIVWDNDGDREVIAHGEKDTIKISGNQKSRVELPLLFYNKNIIPLAAGSITKGSLNMTVKGNADLEFLFLKFNVPFEENRIIETDFGNIISSLLKLIS
ncbi:MAG: hypothetical protein PHV39_09970 [Methanomicrobium sp.]|nr:hypothetical protein [Methanomicrobium sp.]